MKQIDINNILIFENNLNYIKNGIEDILLDDFMKSLQYRYTYMKRNFVEQI